MSITQFYLIQLANQCYLDQIQRSPPPATERRQILPHLHPTASPCQHNLPTPCLPSTPILVQLKNSGRNLEIHVVKGPEDTLKKTAITVLNQLNISPAVEAVSPIHGSRHDHVFYICRLCCSTITHIMNIGAMLHHLTHFHIKDRYNHGDKLTREAFDHLIEIRHLLRQTTDRRIFSIIRSSSDLLPNITWRGNKVNSETNSLTMKTINTSDRGTIERKKQPKPTPTLLSTPPTNRNDQVNRTTPLELSSLRMINTGLSLNLSHASLPSSTHRLKYAEELTKITDMPQPIDRETNEVNTLGETTTTPRTRNGGVRKGKF